MVRGFALGATLASALAAALLSLHFASALRRPLNDLRAGAEALQRGDLGHRIPHQRNDEFGRVARTVNSMADKLEQHQRREALARHRLEDLVQARTTELEQALYTVELVGARRQRLFADISHELRTPTAAILGEAEVTLRGREKPLDEYKGALARIGDAARHLGAVIDDLLTIARNEIDSLSMNAQPQRVGDALGQAIEQAQALGRERNVCIKPPPSGSDATWVNAETQRLRQLFMVVLDNAIRYSHPGGAVQLSANELIDTDGKAQWQLSVTDHGIGIASDDLPRIFERRFRSIQARAHRSDGSGLGLPIARALARAHDGDIQIESQAGRGTTVRITLPAIASAPAADPHALTAETVA